MSFAFGGSAPRAQSERGPSMRSSSGTAAASAPDIFVKCRFCSKAVASDEVEEHEHFFCPLKAIRCMHSKGSGEVCGFLCFGPAALREHQRNCKQHTGRRHRAASLHCTTRSSELQSAAGHSTATRFIDYCEDCGLATRDRKESVQHRAICPRRQVPCPLHCDAWMAREEVPQHLLDFAADHKPLQRPSISDYGGDNPHMVVAVLMEVIQKLAQPSGASVEDSPAMHRPLLNDGPTQPPQQQRPKQGFPGSPSSPNACQSGHHRPLRGSLVNSITSLLLVEGESDGDQMELPSNPDSDLPDGSSAPLTADRSYRKPQRRSANRNAPRSHRVNQLKSPSLEAPTRIISAGDDAVERGSRSSLTPRQVLPAPHTRYEDIVLNSPPPTLRLRVSGSRSRGPTMKSFMSPSAEVSAVDKGAEN